MLQMIKKETENRKLKSYERVSVMFTDFKDFYKAYLRKI